MYWTTWVWFPVEKLSDVLLPLPLEQRCWYSCKYSCWHSSWYSCWYGCGCSCSAVVIAVGTAASTALVRAVGTAVGIAVGTAVQLLVWLLIQLLVELLVLSVQILYPVLCAVMSRRPAIILSCLPHTVCLVPVRCLWVAPPVWNCPSRQLSMNTVTACRYFCSIVSSNCTSAPAALCKAKEGEMGGLCGSVGQCGNAYVLDISGENWRYATTLKSKL